MCNHNKNEILDFYYNLDEPKKRIKVQELLKSCEDCKSYLDILVNTGIELDEIQNEEPLNCTFENIMDVIDQVPQTSVKSVKKISAAPILKLAAIILFILLGLYFVQSKIEISDFWINIENTWLIKTFGKYSFIIILFFGVGSFITLAIAPILYLQSDKGKKLIIK